MKYVVVAVVLAIISVTFLFFKSYLIVDDSTEVVSIKTLVLGEYYSPVKEMIITDKKESKTVLKIKAKTEKSRMHTITITKGVNDFNNMYLDTYEIIYPESQAYAFKVGITYIVKVKWNILYSTDEFTIKYCKKKIEPIQYSTALKRWNSW